MMAVTAGFPVPFAAPCIATVNTSQLINLVFGLRFSLPLRGLSPVPFAPLLKRRAACLSERVWHPYHTRISDVSEYQTVAFAIRTSFTTQ